MTDAREGMAFINEFRGIMAEYDAAVAELQKNRKFFDGLLGLGNHPGSAACHDRMDQQVEELCRRAAEEAEAPEITELVRQLLQAEGRWDGPEYARLMLVATQRHARELIPRLTREAREELAAWYEQKSPRRMRLPVQDQVLKALKNR